MGSSKFSSPFFQKSPLYGAYTSGADGIVPVSYDDIHKDFQQGIADNVSKAYAPKENACGNLEQKLAEGTIKEGAYKVLKAKCAEQNNKNEDSDAGSFENVTGKKPLEGQITSLSDYKKSNKKNPYYINNGYESPYTVNLPDNFND